MKNCIVFITHKTLGYDHALCTFYSIKNQVNASNIKFDDLYIYNTHEDELSSEFLVEYIIKFEIDKLFTNIKLLKSERETKSLSEDISLIRQYFKNEYSYEDRILLLKSDCILSKNYFNEILSIPQDKKDIYFVAPFICAKKRVSNEEIFEYSKRDSVIFSDDITFFVEDQYQSDNTDFNTRTNFKITDDQIKFTSCYVIRDFSCHFLNVGLMDSINITQQSWGGVNFQALSNFFIPTNRCFVIHKYHDILSENRNMDREGPVSEWLKS